MAGSWVPGADDSGFGLDNLPYGVVRHSSGEARPAVRVGDYAVDLAQLADSGLLNGVSPETFAHPSLNGFLALGRRTWTATRRALTELLSDRRGAEAQVQGALVPLAEAEPVMPVTIGDYVDFYASIEHASNLGRLFRPDAEPLSANWRHLPVGYHGRAGTVVVSGTPIRRPNGQRAPSRPGEQPGFGPERRLDFELELGFVTGPGPARGEAIAASDAADYIFGFVLVNDWSAREIQRWEYQPLGPFLGKSFATTISPWVVPLDALASRRVRGPQQRPEPLAYLRTSEPWALDVELEAELNGTVVTRTNAQRLYWNVAQQLAHASSNGAAVAAGDLFASGTISGSEPGTYGSLIEITWGGENQLALRDGSRRTFLEDGDRVVFRGHAGPVSLGEAHGRIEPARAA